MAAELDVADERVDWAESRIIDFTAIEHTRPIGSVTVWGETIDVAIERRDDLDLSTRPATVTRTPMEVSLDGRRMDSAVARALANLLIRAVDEIEAASG